jgi:hypothetical protein
MNLNPEESQTSPASTTSSPSSSTAASHSPLELLIEAETPLFGLKMKPMDQMTEEELSAAVLRIQQLRTSAQTFRAAVESGEREPRPGAVEAVKNMLSDYV